MSRHPVETIAYLLSEMDAEAMPNERRAVILAGYMMRPNKDDQAWAARLDVPPLTALEAGE